MIAELCTAIGIAACPAVHEGSGPIFEKSYYGIYHPRHNIAIVHDLEDKNTVVHELCHAFVYQEHSSLAHDENFEHCMLKQGEEP